jgi:plasmid stabilization system protein ParE
MELRWSLPAAGDLERICERIERDNPDAARRVARTIYDGCARLRDYPYLGRASNRVTGRRELVFPPLPYIVVYRVTEQGLKSRASSTVRRTGHERLEGGGTERTSRREGHRRPSTSGVSD